MTGVAFLALCVALVLVGRVFQALHARSRRIDEALARADRFRASSLTDAQCLRLLHGIFAEPSDAEPEKLTGCVVEVRP